MSSSSKKNKGPADFFKGLQRLRAVTNSSALNKASIIVDATKYIMDLKQKVDQTLNVQDIVGTSSPQLIPIPQNDDQSPSVSVETLAIGFQINVYAAKNCTGLLVSILEAFEELGLEVINARVSCSDIFQLQVISGESMQRQDDNNIDAHQAQAQAQVVKQAVLQAINNCCQS